MFDTTSDSPRLPVRTVDPPIDVRVIQANVWPPGRLKASPPLWVRASGLELTDVPGQLVELLLTQQGDLLARCLFSVKVARRRIAENALLPWGAWAPTSEEGARQLREIVASFSPLEFDHHPWPGVRPFEDHLTVRWRTNQGR